MGQPFLGRALGVGDTLEPIASAVYAPAATLWRINLGGRGRKRKDEHGFWIDLDTGEWQRSQEEVSTQFPAPDDGDLAPTATKARVIPFVEDHHNLLLFQVSPVPDGNTLASLQYALKRGIEAVFQIEDGELAAEPLPDETARTRVLYYEAMDGGAGVLARLVSESDALARVAREALRICHFDEAGNDLGQADGQTERCERACYDCLQSYTNQREHGMLDRFLVRPYLFKLAGVSAQAGAGSMARSDQIERLVAACDSELERTFVRYLHQRGYRLPDEAQLRIDGTRPDFFYAGSQAAVYVDGHPHTYVERQARDAAATTSLQDLGITVIRVTGEASWAAAVAAYPWVFGEGSAA